MTQDQYGELIDFLGKKFGNIDKRFDAIDRRFDAMDRRFEAMDKRFEAMDQRFEAMDQRFDALETRLVRVEILAEEDRNAIQIVAEGVQANRDAIARLEERMDRKLEELRDFMMRGFRDLGERVSRLEIRVGMN